MPLQSPAAGISRAGANLASQSGQISLRTASNIGNIMMRVAQIKAAGIVEGSRAWQNALQQIGVTARDYPIIKRQMEAADYAESQRPTGEAILGQEKDLGALQLGEQERTVKANQLYRELLPKSITTDPSGKVTKNNESIYQALTDAGFGDFALKVKDVDTARLGAARKLSESQKKERFEAFKKVGNAAEAVVTAPEGLKDAPYQAFRGMLESVVEDPKPQFPDSWNPGLDTLLHSFFTRHLEEKSILDMAKGPEPTAEMKNFADFLPDYLAAEGLPSNPKTRIQARKEYRNVQKGNPTSAFGLWIRDNPGGTIEQWNAMQVEQSKLKGAASEAPEVSPPGTSREDILAKFEPSIQRKAGMLLGYKVPATGYMLTRSPEWTMAAEAASEADPTWNAAEYPSRLKLLNDFKSGRASRNVRSLNTLIGHLDSLSQTSEKLDNTSILLWNRLANRTITEVGDARVTNFEKAVIAVQNEAATLFKGTGATDQEIKEWRATINSSQSPEQLQEGILQMVDLMSSRLSALTEQYEMGMGKPPDFQLLTGKSREILKSMGVKDLEEGQGQVAPPRPSGVPENTVWDEQSQNWVEQ